MSSTHLYHQIGGLLVESKKIVAQTLPWIPFYKGPVFDTGLMWMPRYEKLLESTEERSITLVSPTFCLGDTLLKANLLIFNEENVQPTLCLKVSQEHVGQFFAKVTVSKMTNFMKIDPNSSITCQAETECVIGKANECGDHGWELRTLYHSDQISTCYFRVVIQFILYDKSSTFGCDLKERKLLHDFRNLGMEHNPAGLGTDIILKTGATELGAHKFVLSARSPVLKAMLATDMAEARSGVITLQQMSVEAAQDFIGFIYSGGINSQQLINTAEELLQIATMYDMPDLKAVCETALRGMITAHNTAQFLVLASLHDAPFLKADTLAFLASKKSEVTATEEWTAVKTAHTELILEAILELL